eukprot:TRINITY_DN27556_c0_g1_i1.p1 TRINITY_DN27556_c0_g1~~TRINITY_DN27556_c0_g1_i1.p1  ORF type:complete len:464 (-),score=86.70 TRINITY_DN27556_c0_g1_i1:69-1460(-)
MDRGSGGDGMDQPEERKQIQSLHPQLPMSSRLPGFSGKSREERLKDVQRVANLNTGEMETLANGAISLPFSRANHMVENVIGVFPLPLSVATNFRVNGREMLVPMVIEEASVVAASSNAAKLAMESGGFSATSAEQVMIGQIQVIHLDDVHKAKAAVDQHRQELVEMANEVFPSLQSFGGGAQDVQCRVIDTPRGEHLVVHLLVNCLDAMGANSINSMCEGISPLIEELTRGRCHLRILSNLSVHRMFKSRATWTKNALERSVAHLGMKGEDVVDAILDAWAFAVGDPFRATTHNKGIMNGIDAVVVATGNDWRAIESGAHAYASFNRERYLPLTAYWKNDKGDLVGEIALPLSLGLVGGATRTHPVAQISLKLLGVKTARELGEIIASVGLAQNFAAMRALATEGIQKGHMRLHAQAIASSAGAPTGLVEAVARRLLDTHGRSGVTVERARAILAEMVRSRL